MTKKNEKFWKLSKPEKRVAIAKDVLKWIFEEKIIPETGAYVESYSSFPDEGKLDKYLNNEPCQACALGACFVGMVDLGNNVNIEDIDIGCDKKISDDSIRPLLRNIFTPNQLALIESAFEKYKCDAELHNTVSILSFEEAISFGGKYRYSNERLIAIMQNIIKNKGTFKP